MLNSTILTNRIIDFLENDKSLAQDIIDTCEVIDSAKKDLFKQKGANYVEAYSNVWNVFLERLNMTVKYTKVEEPLVMPNYMEDHLVRLEQPGYYQNVHEISFINAYANTTIDAKIYTGKLDISLLGVDVPISMITEAVYRVRGELKKRARQHIFQDDLINVQIRAMKILLNTHWVALLTQNQRTEVGTVHAERFQTLVEKCRAVGLKVITGYVDEVFVEGGADLIEEVVDEIRVKHGYALHIERHDRCLFENTRKYILNIQGRFVGYKFKERK